MKWILLDFRRNLTKIFFLSSVFAVFVSCLAENDPPPPPIKHHLQVPAYSSSVVDENNLQVSNGPPQKVYPYWRGGNFVHPSPLITRAAVMQRNKHLRSNSDMNEPNFNRGDGGSGGNVPASFPFPGSNIEESYLEPQYHTLPQQHADSYTSATGGTRGPAPMMPAYTYFYQHYPNGVWSWDDDGIGSGLSALNWREMDENAGMAMWKILKAFGRGVLMVKPFLILIFLAAIAIPLFVLFAPLPSITITGDPQMAEAAAGGRSAAEKFTDYLMKLTEKVLNSEECLERILCKLPQAPEEYRNRVKAVWEEYGSKIVMNQRTKRGLDAYFSNEISQKDSNLKCNQKFKCSNE